MKAATVSVPAPLGIPPGLVEEFAALGFAAKLTGEEIQLTRSGRTAIPNDPDSLAPKVDRAIDEEERKSLAAIAATFEG